MKEILILTSTIIILVIIAKLISRHFIEKGHKAWLSRIIGVSVGSVVALIFFISIIPTPDKDISKTAEVNSGKNKSSLESNEKLTKDSVEFTTDETKKTLEITPEVFAKRMNANLEAAGSSFKLKVQVSSGEVSDTFSHRFNDNLAILGAVDKVSKNILRIIIMTSCDETNIDISAVDSLAIVLSAYSAVLGENIIETDETLKIVTKLLEKRNKSSKKETRVSTVFNGIEFSLKKYSDNIFYVFTAEPA
ncbi:MULTISPECIES: hypothetical protein [unclassified Arsenophonus]|uniref:hypothetical protein n=1 Tax=unclassified Arsenophonus TaxID=2627083 RepID=UPI0028630352|nr:hypothetical protein [Arsenophonus sp.]MDR5610995.1 hypothetical protein [Arsenophonus sp.]MDR5614950.1 hypothetical protein [Arsenophonus sp.]